MAIRDCSGMPDDQVPTWVREARERSRAAAKLERERLCGTCSYHFGLRAEVLAHCRDTGHVPLVTTPDDRFLKLPAPKATP